MDCSLNNNPSCVPLVASDQRSSATSSGTALRQAQGPLTGKTVVLGVTGSIAAYKIANLASMLVKLNADVHVIMTQNV